MFIQKKCREGLLTAHNFGTEALYEHLTVTSNVPVFGRLLLARAYVEDWVPLFHIYYKTLNAKEKNTINFQKGP